MDSRAALRTAILQGQDIVERYLDDLSNADLLVRPVPGANHIAWQLGHLIAAEHAMVEKTFPGSMPKLPEGFAQQHSKETVASDDPGAFRTKDEYLALMRQQREGTLAALAKATDEQLDGPMQPPFNHFLPSVGHMFALQGTHWVMHAGQWAIIRRKLGKPPLF